MKIMRFCSKYVLGDLTPSSFEIFVFKTHARLPMLGESNKSLEISRLLALHRVFDVPWTDHRNGVHLSFEPECRRTCDYLVVIITCVGP